MAQGCAMLTQVTLLIDAKESDIIMCGQDSRIPAAEFQHAPRITFDVFL